MAGVEVAGVEGMKAIVGKEIGPSDSRAVTQADIDAFAEVSGDHQWIHVDPERAKNESPYGTTIAHGNLTLSLADSFRKQLIPVDRLRARGQLRLEQGALPGAGPGRQPDQRDQPNWSPSTSSRAAGGRR